MSTTSAQNFINRMQTDFDFASKIVHARSKSERNCIAQSEGYHFTKKELDSVATDIDELNSVVFLKENTREGCSPESCCS